MTSFSCRHHPRWPSCLGATAVAPKQRRFSRSALVLGLAAVACASTPASGNRLHWQYTSARELLKSSSDALRRESAALVLGHRANPRDVPLLVERLSRDDNLWVRARCAEALGMIGSTVAIKPLLSALGREKNQRVRRVVGEALMRLGRREGLLELMWQLQAGTNHGKAESMEALVSITGQPLAQKVSDWWSYLAAQGYSSLARRPPGSPAVRELGGQPQLFVPPGDAGAWQQLPAVVIRLEPTREAITAKLLEAHVHWHGPLPDGCLLLLQTSWQTAAPFQPRPGRSRAASKRGDAPPPGPGLTVEAVDYLLARAPKLLGVGSDTPTLDPPSSTGHPARKRLLARKRLVIEAVSDLDQLNATGTRLIVFRSASRAHLLALLP